MTDSLDSPPKDWRSSTMQMTCIPRRWSTPSASIPGSFVSGGDDDDGGAYKEVAIEYCECFHYGDVADGSACGDVPEDAFAVRCGVFWHDDEFVAAVCDVTDLGKCSGVFVDDGCGDGCAVFVGGFFSGSCLRVDVLVEYDPHFACGALVELFDHEFAGSGGGKPMYASDGIAVGIFSDGCDVG